MSLVLIFVCLCVSLQMHTCTHKHEGSYKHNMQKCAHPTENRTYLHIVLLIFIPSIDILHHFKHQQSILSHNTIVINTQIHTHQITFESLNIYTHQRFGAKRGQINVLLTKHNCCKILRKSLLINFYYH